MIKPPYLLFVADESDPRYAKTATGIHHWRPELCGGVYRFNNSTLDYGLPVYDIPEAVKAGLKTLVIGLAPCGGGLEESWRNVIIEALRAGMDVASGLHSRLNDIVEIRQLVRTSPQQVFDVRHPTEEYSVGTGKKRTGRRMLTVGTDCAVGKKFTALSIDRELKSRGADCTFRGTGQTGVLIAGSGVCVDAVISDHLSGAAETLSPDNEADHWDIIEGQGSLFHPAYAGVALGLLHGSQPDAIIVCHEAGRPHLLGFDDFPVPELKECISLNLQLGRLTNQNIVCAGVSINTMQLSDRAARSYLEELSSEFMLPAVDPVRFGVSDIVDKMGLAGQKSS